LSLGSLYLRYAHLAVLQNILGGLSGAAAGLMIATGIRYCKQESFMNNPPASLTLAAHLALLSSISFGGFPTVLPDVHNFVAANGWVTDREFADFLQSRKSCRDPI
jgi:chromate transport protein ChrA